MPLPVLVAGPHGSLVVPEEVRQFVVLSSDALLADSDEGAPEIYRPLCEEVADAVIAPIARAIVDMNRAPDDIRKDGVVKTHTCWDVPIYDPLPGQALLSRLVQHYHVPYHRRLTQLARTSVHRVGLDCHTMAAVGPPVGPDPGQTRPMVCLSDADGTCPAQMMTSLAAAFRDAFGAEHVTVNEPFRGGYTIRTHAVELPWIQIELSRSPVMSAADKGVRVLAAVRQFCTDL